MTIVSDKEKPIMYDSPEAAKFVTGLSGWVDRNGFFCGDDEDRARWSGCTHKMCNDCGKNIHRKSYSCCQECRIKHDEERYRSLEKTPWDGSSPVCEFDGDRYFFDGIEEVEQHCLDDDIKIGSLRLVHCEPVPLPEIDIENHFTDAMGEDQDIDDIPIDILKAVQTLNDLIQSATPLSWQPTNKAVVSLDGMEQRIKKWNDDGQGCKTCIGFPDCIEGWRSELGPQAAVVPCGWTKGPYYANAKQIESKLLKHQNAPNKPA